MCGRSCAWQNVLGLRKYYAENHGCKPCRLNMQIMEVVPEAFSPFG